MSTIQMEKIRTQPLETVARFIRGITFTPDDKVAPGTAGSAVCMRTANVQDVLDESDLIAVPLEFVRRKEQFLMESDILVSTANSWNLVGKCSWVPNLSYRATAGGFISILRADRSKVLPRYLYYWFASDKTQHDVRLCGRQTTNISNMSYERCLALEIPLPPLSEQKRIADILDKAAAIRRKRQEVIVTVEDLIHSAFMQIVGPEAEGYSNWPHIKIRDLASPEHGSMRTGPFGSTLKHSEFVDEGVAVLGIDNAVQNRFAWGQRRFISEDKYEELKGYTVRPGDVLITIMATTGRSAVVPDNIPVAINTKHLACITLNRTKAEPEFISHSIHRHPAVLAQLGTAGRGAIMNGLNLGIIKSLGIRTPPIEVQQRFTSVVYECRNLDSRLQYANQESDDLFNALVQRAFQGML